MIGRTNTGGGGGGLNYKVVGGTTAPSNPKENTIWIMTDAKITSHVFCTTEPENPVEGMAWIRNGKTSAVSFNALKKNGIVILPVAVCLYVDGAWVQLDSYIYQAGIWVQFATACVYLFNMGDKCENLTGGWGAVSGGLSGHYGKTPSVTFSGNTMTAEFSPTRITVGQVKTVNAIDLTERNKLVFHITDVVDPASASLVGVIDDSSEKIVMVASAPVAVGDVEIDLSAVSGSYKVGIVLKTTDSKNGHTLVTVDSIGLE